MQSETKSDIGAMLFSMFADINKAHLPKFEIRYKDGTIEDEFGTEAEAISALRDYCDSNSHAAFLPKMDGVYQGQKLVKKCSEVFDLVEREQTAKEEDERLGEQEYRADQKYFAASNWF